MTNQPTKATLMSSDSNQTASQDTPRIGEDLERYRPYLLLIAQANLGSALKRKVEASDIVQLTLLQAFQDQDAFRGQTEAEKIGWLKAILRNRLIDFARHWRGAKRDARRDREIVKAIDGSIARFDDWIAASQSSPSQKAAHNEQLMQLPDALNQLPADIREVIIMHHLQGMKLTKIAAHFDCDPTTIGRRIHQGLKQLKSIMQDEQ